MSDLSKKLAKIHAEFGIYDNKSFDAPNDMNIIYQISSVPKLANLRQFYVDYQREYINESQRRPHQTNTLHETNVSKTVDLPFAGDVVIETGKAKYLFVFEGSLAPPIYLTITLHSCFWLLGPNPSEFPLSIQTIMGGGKSIYSKRYKWLGINPIIAANSYVTDAVRLGKTNGEPDYSQNRYLLKREIELLNPELVVLAGKKAEKTIGDESESNPLYFKVPFPGQWTMIDKNKAIFEELRKRLSSNNPPKPIKILKGIR